MGPVYLAIESKDQPDRVLSNRVGRILWHADDHQPESGSLSEVHMVVARGSKGDQPSAAGIQDCHSLGINPIVDK